MAAGHWPSRRRRRESYLRPDGSENYCHLLISYLAHWRGEVGDGMDAVLKMMPILADWRRLLHAEPENAEMSSHWFSTRRMDSRAMHGLQSKYFWPTGVTVTLSGMRHWYRRVSECRARLGGITDHHL